MRFPHDDAVSLALDHSVMAENGTRSVGLFMILHLIK